MVKTYQKAAALLLALALIFVFPITASAAEMTEARVPVMRTMAIQLPEELFERLKAYLKKNNLKQKQFIIGLIEDALEEDEESTIAQAESEGSSETEDPDEPDEDTDEE